MVNLDAIATLNNSWFGWAVLTLQAVATWGSAFAMLFRSRCVPGSHRRYRTVTVLKTLLPPAVALETYSAVASIADGAYLNAVIAVLNLAFFAWCWHQIRDDDNWWNGRGRKIRQWFRRTSASRSAATSTL